jgi:hypothetical protein
VRGVQAFPPKQGTNATGLPFGLIGLGQDALFVLAREDAALRPGNNLGVGVARSDCGRLAALGLSAIGGRDRQICLRVFHAEFPSRPAL